MAYGVIPTRVDGTDPNAAADINQLIENDEYLKGEIEATQEAIENSRDLLINGNMRWWQRGTSFTGVTNGVFTADRWKGLIANGSGTAPTFNVERDNTDGINYYMKITVTGAGVLGASMYAGMYQKYEFYTSMRGKTVSVRARVKAPRGKSYRVYLWDGVAGSNYVGTGTGDFQEIVLENFTVNSAATALQVTYYIANGTSYIPASGDIHYIDRIQLTEGATALQFLPYDPILDYKKCLRYYEKSYNYADAPGAVSVDGTMIAFVNNANRYLFPLAAQFSVTKRTTPTVTWYAYDGTSMAITLYGGSNYTVSSSYQKSEKKTGCPYITTTPTAGDLVYGHWVADAEL